MPRSKEEKMELKEQVDLILDRIKHAESTKDFDLIVSNLAVLDAFAEELKKPETKELFNKVKMCARRLEYSAKKEEDRRAKIKEAGQKYEEASKKLEKCDEATMSYDEVLNSPTASSFSYDSLSTPPTLEEEVLVDYFNIIADALGVSHGTYKTLAELNTAIAQVEIEMDECAFTINSLNGIYDPEVLSADLKRAEELNKKLTAPDRIAELKNILSSTNKSMFNKISKSGNIDMTKLKNQIAALGVPRDEATRELLAQLKELKELKELPPLNTSQQTLLDNELRGILAKYNVSSFDDLKALTRNTDLNVSQESISPFAASTLKNIVKDSRPNVSLEKPTRRIGTAIDVISVEEAKKNNSPETATCSDIDSMTKYLQQAYGYTPMVGRNSIVYAKPIYKEGLFGRKTKKLKSMEIVEESIASIAESPYISFETALDEANFKRKSMGLEPLNKKDLLTKFRELLHDAIPGKRGISVDSGKMDEAIQRILIVKSSNSKAELNALESLFKDPKFPGGPENYDAPKITASKRLYTVKTNNPGFITKRLGLDIAMKTEIDTSEPSECFKDVEKEKPLYLIYNSGNRGKAPAVARDSRHVVKDRTHYKDERDDR